MNIYETMSMGNLIHANEYVGRGIVIGKPEYDRNHDGKYVEHREDDRIWSEKEVAAF